MQGGVRSLRDFTDGTNLLTWEQFEVRGFQHSARRAFEKVKSNLIWSRGNYWEGEEKCNVFVSEGALVNGSSVWEVTLQKKFARPFWPPGSLPGRSVKTFTICNSVLKDNLRSPIPGLLPLFRVITGKVRLGNSSSPETAVIGLATEDIGLADRFSWKDGTSIFDTNTAHLRRLMASELPEIHSALRRWSETLRWDPSDFNLWSTIWLPYRAQKENTFLWKVAYQVPATNAWRHPSCRRSDP